MLGEVCIPAVSAHPQQSPDMNKAIPRLGCLVISAATEQIVLGDGQSSAIQPIAIQRKRQLVLEKKNLIAFNPTLRAFLWEDKLWLQML